MKTLGSRIRSHRLAKGLTQEAVALELGVSNGAVSQWELNTGRPELNSLVALGDLFGVTIDELVRGNASVSESAKAGTAAEMALLKHFRAASPKIRAAILTILEG